MRLIIAGGRDFSDYPRLAGVAKEVLHGLKRRNIEIISGTARGADKLGAQFAKAHQLHLTEMPADWQRFGKSAGYRRNEAMAEYAKQSHGMLLAFWNGSSKGTYHMINLANKHGLRSVVIKY